MQTKKEELEMDMGQWTGSKLGKEYIKAVYCHLAYLTFMQSTSCKMPGWMKQKLESRFPGEISITSDKSDDITLMMKVKEESEKFSSVQSFSCVQLCDHMNRSTPGLPVHHQLPESIQTHVNCVGDAIQPSHPLLSLFPPALNFSQPQSLFQ